MESSELIIDCAALRANLARVKEQAADRYIWAVVKANGYGTGMVQVAKEFLTVADGLAVARLSEAETLIDAGFKVPILVLGPLPCSAALAKNIHISASHQDDLLAIRDRKLTNPVHLKIDTGMGRLGFDWQSDAWIPLLKELPAPPFGLWTHYANADQPEHLNNALQRQRFWAAHDRLVAAGFKPEQIHIANSGGLAMLDPNENAIRIGLYLYGGNPWSKATALPLPSPVVSWRAPLKQKRSRKIGDLISYGSEYTVAEPGVYAVLPVGYADGLSARPKQTIEILVGAHRAEICGRITMDLSIIRLPPSESTDEAYLLGPSWQSNGIQLAELAERTGRIEYECLTAISCRVKRIYRSQIS